jgi:uncharacterized protein YukE
MARIVSGEDLDDTARHLEYEARVLHDAHDSLRRQTDALRWEGNARRTYGHRLGAQLGNLTDTAALLTEASSRLRAVAAQAREERARLDRLEREVFDQMRLAPDPASFLARHGVAALPPRWDTAWTEVHRQVVATEVHHQSAAVARAGARS